MSEPEMVRRSSMPESLQALQRTNPRRSEGFAESVEAVAAAVRTELLFSPATLRTEARPRQTTRPRRRGLVGVSAAGAALAVAAGLTVFFTVGTPGGGPGVADAAAAVRTAAAVTAASAEKSGTAVVRITHNGELWAGSTIRWHDGDMSLRSDTPGRQGKVGDKFLVVDGMMYATDPVDGGWSEMGSPDSIDPGSGTTPDEYLAAVRDDVGGAALQRITKGMTGLTAEEFADGATVYRGSVKAGLIARESGFKDGESLRVFPFGFVAHDEAGDPAALLDTAVTVGAEGVVRQIAVRWGGTSSAWTYTVTYSHLGATPALEAPANAKPFEKRVPDGALVPARPATK
jgi:hypothetical protein